MDKTNVRTREKARARENNMPKAHFHFWFGGNIALLRIKALRKCPRVIVEDLTIFRYD